MPRFKPGKPGTPRDLSAVGTVMEILLYLLLTVALCIGGVLLYRVVKRMREEQAQILAVAIEAEPDIEDESTTADELPEEGWMKMARELMEKGELRLALRAVFLGSLAHLAGKEFIHITRFKSNLDYKHELERHAHQTPGVLDIFNQSALIYESIWYGMHDATMELLNNVIDNQARLKAGE